jgi:hypothetical protein
MVRWRTREEREEWRDQHIEGCARRALVAGVRVPGEHVVEFLEVDVCEVVFEA